MYAALRYLNHWAEHTVRVMLLRRLLRPALRRIRSERGDEAAQVTALRYYERPNSCCTLRFVHLIQGTLVTRKHPKPSGVLEFTYHGSTPSEAGAGVFILVDTPKISSFETRGQN